MSATRRWIVCCPQCGTEFNARDWRSRIRLVIETGCWEWLGARSDTGYGIRNDDRRTFLVHRWVYEQLRGPIPEGLVLRHTCDNRICVNPDHLLPGTQTENMADALSRNRVARGESLPGAKLTEADVRDIRARLAKVETQRSIARHFGISSPRIHRIAHGAAWTHVESA